MATHEDERLYERARIKYNQLSNEDKKAIDKWLKKSKESFYDNRPFATRIRPPMLLRISDTYMFNILYGEMQYDQISSPPHTPR